MNASTFHGLVLGTFALLISAASLPARAAADATLVVRVETQPVATSGTVRFTGTPAGQTSLGSSGDGALRAVVAPGQHRSVLQSLGATLRQQGYRLTAITCDDRAGNQQRSHGDLATRTATFEVDRGEKVTCVFQLGLRVDRGEKVTSVPQRGLGQACTCPREGHWNVVNHTGSMACTGAMSITMPLTASTELGTLEARSGCATVHAAGMSEDEADMDMHRQSDCSYVGTVGGERDGIPMTIKFRWNVENPKRITGNLKSTVAQSGMTCRMSRTYELDYVRP
ncbi:MAG: hypothetical protein WCD66_02400 [Rhodanobacteraceae bacterium]